MGTASHIIKAAGTASAFGVAVMVAPLAHAAPSGPWMDISLSTTTNGNTVTVAHADRGVQHLHIADGKTFASDESGGMRLDFGDGSSPLGSDGMGGSQCTNTGMAPFHTPFGNHSHTYAKPGTYVITATGTYCGAHGEQTATKKTTVSVGARDASTSTPATAPAAPMPHKAASSTKPIGPQVQTDLVTSANSNSSVDVALAGLALLGLAGGSVMVVRRRS